MALLTKRYRVLIDVTVNVEPIKQHQYADLEDAERDDRLLQVLLAQQGVIEELLQVIAQSAIEDLGHEDIKQQTGLLRDIHEIIPSVFDHLPENDATFYRKYNGSTDALSESIRAHVTAISMKNL